MSGLPGRPNRPSLPLAPPTPVTPPPPAAPEAGTDPAVAPVAPVAPAPPVPAGFALPAVPGAGLPAPQPAAPANTVVNQGYVSAGNLTAEMLLNGYPGMFAHLNSQIIEVRDWVQTWITDNGRSNDIAEARSASDADKRAEKRAEMISLIDRLILQYISKESVARGQDRAILIASVINEILGLGPIEPLWDDPRITEVMVNGPRTVFVEIAGQVVRVPGAEFRDRDHLLEVCQRILAPLNRSVDNRNPLEDGRLPDGSRVNIVHYVSAPGGPLLTIRRFPDTVWTMRDLVSSGSLSEDMAVNLSWLIYNKCSAVVVGGTGAGKTSLLNALSSCVPRTERIVTVEDSLELRLHPGAHVAAMEGRPPSATGENEVSIRRLVKNALRMRPDRIIVGEVRDASALDMLQAMNTGHEGSMTTVHANGAEEAVNRLTVLVAQGGEISEDKVDWLIGDAVDLFVVQRRYEDGSRRVQGIYEIPSRGASTDHLRPICLWEWVQTDTTPDGKFIGEYQQRNPISDELIEKRRLTHARKFTMADVEAMSELPDEMTRPTS